MLEYLQNFDPYHHIFLSIALGMLVGLQREWADTPVAGIRSFTFISLLGTICALLAETYGGWFIGLGFMGALLMALVGHWQHKAAESSASKSLVTEFTILLMFVVGVMIRTETLILAASVACLIAAILHIKLELHAIASKLTNNELRSIMQFLVIAIVILPLIPNESYGPYGALNPYNIWLLVVLITGLGLFGYILNKFAGEKIGVLGGGLLGGVISSTATTFSYAKLSREQKLPTFSGLVILIAWSTLYIRVYLEVQFLTSKMEILLPLVILTIASALLIFWSWRRNQQKEIKSNVKSDPVDIKTAISFAVIYSLIIILVSYLKDEVGDWALSIVAFIAGLLDMDAITLSTARLVDKGVLNPSLGITHIFIALFANTLFKGLLPLFIGNKSLFRILLIPWSAILALQLLIAGYYFFQ